jgi:hypothetical protein
VSNENNFSAYAAIKMLLFILNNNTMSTTDPMLLQAISELTNLSDGLESWFTKYLLAPPVDSKSSSVFYQGGHVPFSGGFDPTPINSTGGFAADCQTWGSAVLGASFIDNVVGKKLGTAYNIWQQTKQYSAYYAADGSLAGVGYTIDPTHTIWSSEWSWGAVLSTRELSLQYQQIKCAQCSTWASSLMADSKSMAANLVKRVSQGGMQDTSGAYLYCNTRYFIPWGWYASQLPSLCSTAWATFNAHQFNPFMLGGGPNARYYQVDGSLR